MKVCSVSEHNQSALVSEFALCRTRGDILKTGSIYFLVRMQITRTLIEGDFISDETRQFCAR